MAPSRVTDADFLTIRFRLEANSLRVRVATAVYRVVQHVSISKEKIKFSKAAEHIYVSNYLRLPK